MEWSDYSGGLYLTDDGANMMTVPRNALIQCENAEPLPSGGLRGRRGRAVYTTAGTDPDTGLAIGQTIFLFRHYPRTGDASFVAAWDNGTNVVIRKDTAGTGNFTTVTGGTGHLPGHRIFATNWPDRNLTFMANGTTAFGIQRYDNVGLAQVSTTAGVAVNGPYLHVWKSRLWATLDDIVYASDLLDEKKFNGENALNVSDNEGGAITGINSVGDFLIILKKTSLWRFNGDIVFGGQLTQYGDLGCIAPLTVQRTPYGIMFLARDGLRLTDGQNTETIELSRPIRPLFVSRSGQTTYPDAVGVWHPRKMSYYLSLAPQGSTVYALHMVQTANGLGYWWSKLTNTTLYSAAVWDSENDTGQLFFGSSSGFIWQQDTGLLDVADTITTTVQVSASPFVPERLFAGRATYAKALFRGSSPLTVGLRYDNHVSDDITVSLGVTQAVGMQDPRAVVSPDKHGQFLSLTATHTDSYDFELHDLRTDDTVRGHRRWRFK